MQWAMGKYFRFLLGERCQYKDECEKDEDCGRRGQCVDVDATTAPRKQCFCEIGYFGDECTKGKAERERLFCLKL